MLHTPPAPRSHIGLILLAAVCVVAPVSLSAQSRPSPAVFGLTPGPYAVGYAVRHEYDYSRTFKKRFDYFGERTQGEIARPIQITIWYPAGKNAGTPMKRSEYWNAIATETDFAPRTPEELRGLRDDRERMMMMEWRVPPDSMGAVKARLDSLLGLPALAVRDAPPAPGRFPLILHMPGYNGSGSEHAPLFEYLASHGFVVAAVPNMGRYSRTIDDEPASLDVPARDLEYGYAVMRTLPYVDADRVGTTGMSWGGMSNVLFASRNAYVRAVATLDGAITMPQELGLIEAVPGYRHESIRVPYLQLLVSPEEAKFRPKDLRFWKALRYSDAFMVQFNGVEHADFTPQYRRLMNTVVADPTKVAYLEAFSRAELEYVLRFFEAALQGNTTAGASLAGLSRELGLPDTMVARFETKKGLKAPPSVAEFRAIVRSRGAKVAADVYRAALEVEPDTKLVTSPVMGPLYMEAFDAHRFDEAVAICELWREGMPHDPGPLFSLGRTYRAMGNKDAAITVYEKILTMVPPGRQADAAQRALDELRGGGP